MSFMKRIDLASSPLMPRRLKLRGILIHVWQSVYTYIESCCSKMLKSMDPHAQYFFEKKMGQNYGDFTCSWHNNLAQVLLDRLPWQHTRTSRILLATYSIFRIHKSEM